MINFACKLIPFEDIIRCAFGITKTEYNIFEFLTKKQDITVEDMTEELKKDRTTIQKAVKSLVDKGIVIRRQRNIDMGGYQYIYSLKDKQELKKQIKEIIKSWIISAINKVENW